MQELTTAEKIQQMRGLSLKVRDLSGMSPDQARSKEAIVKYVLGKNLRLEGKELDIITAHIMNSSEQMLQIGENRMSAQEAALNTGKMIQNLPHFQSKDEWLNKAKTVIENMTDGEITAQDLSSRNGFIRDIEGRQDELYTALHLYQNNKLPAAKELAAQIQAIISVLEKTKTAIKKSTKDHEEAIRDPQISQEERNKAKVYLGVLDYMQKDKHIPQSIQTKLELNHGVTFDYSVAEQLLKSKDSAKSVTERVQRINELRGRQSSLNISKSEVRHLNNFNAKHFQMLMEQQRTM